jgi:hypothetical protein
MKHECTKTGAAIILLMIVFPVICIPASGTEALSGVVLSPAAVPLIPGARQEVQATIQIIPSGSTTFSQNHQLQLSTGLAAGSWNAQTLVNNVPAATIPKEGNVLFINGYLLSYPTTSDVSVLVSVSGTVPQSSAGSDLNLLLVQELDNSGQVVSGSTLAVTEPVQAGGTPATPATLPPVPTGTGLPPVTTPSPVPTRVPGFASGLAVTGVLAVLVCMRKKDEIAG